MHTPKGHNQAGQIRIPDPPDRRNQKSPPRTFILPIGIIII
jgi:hypothetical protein